MQLFPDLSIYRTATESQSASLRPKCNVADTTQSTVLLTASTLASPYQESHLP